MKTRSYLLLECRALPPLWSCCIDCRSTPVQCSNLPITAYVAKLLIINYNVQVFTNKKDWKTIRLRIQRHRFYGQVDLHNKPRSNLIMLIERPHATSYLLAILIFATICEIFTLEMCMALTFRNRSRSNVNMPIERPIVGSNHVFPICQHLRDTNFSMYSIRIFSLQNEVNNVGDLDEN